MPNRPWGHHYEDPPDGARIIIMIRVKPEERERRMEQAREACERLNMQEAA